MEIYKFFNSAPGDVREYQAADFADYFGSVLSTGLLHTDEEPDMAVSVVAGTLTTKVSPGKAIMKGHLYENTSDLTLAHTLPEATLDRIDRIVLRLDLRNSERSIKLRVKEGVASASPIAPALQRDNFIYEISLARVLVRRNTVQLLAGDLVDERLDENVGGLVHSLISIPTSQFQAQWDEFMAGIQDEGFASASEFATHLAESASLTNKGHVQLSNATNSTSEVLAATPKAVKSAYDRAEQAFQSASDGKTRIANAVTVKGVTASPSDTFPTLATKIGQIPVGKAYASGTIYPKSFGADTVVEVRGLPFRPVLVGCRAIGQSQGYSMGFVDGQSKFALWANYQGGLGKALFEVFDDGFRIQSLGTTYQYTYEARG